MRAGKSSLLLAVAVLTLPLTATGALAAAGCPEGVGSLGDSGLSVGVCVPGAPPTGVQPVSTDGGGVRGSGSQGSGQASPYTWQRTYPNEYPRALRTTGNPLAVQPGPTPTCTGAGGVEGRPYVDQLIDTRTGSVVNSSSGCEVPGQAGPAGTPAPPPPPPSPAEVWRQVPLPTPVLGINPDGKGLTGLKTWLWSTNPGAVTARTSIRGYTASATATPVRWVWHMWKDGDTPNLNPNPRVESATPGSEASPAATYVYETKGDYTITLTVWWTGEFTFTGFGVFQRVSLGDTSREASRPYHVIEVVSVLVAP